MPEQRSSEVLRPQSPANVAAGKRTKPMSPKSKRSWHRILVDMNRWKCVKHLAQVPTASLENHLQ